MEPRRGISGVLGIVATVFALGAGALRLNGQTVDCASGADAVLNDDPVSGQTAPGDTTPVISEHRIHWEGLLLQEFGFLSFQHAFRVVEQEKTRHELGGKFFADWGYEIQHIQWNRWDDGDHDFTSWLGHPMQGAIVFRIYQQNDDDAKGIEQDFHNPLYRRMLWRGFLVTTIQAFEFKLGPISEETIGHVGLHTAPNGTNRTGLNDYVTNETLGPLVVIGEDWMDKHIARPFERRGHSRALVLLVRGFTSPMRSFADLFALHAPWYREDRQ